MTSTKVFQASIAVLIPCLNEEITIGKVVATAKQTLPDATIFVFDNNSTDRTAEIAKEAGATVIHEQRPGKGNVVASMFRLIDAEYYVMIDGDDTYCMEEAQKLLEPLMQKQADMCVATRLEEYSQTSFRPFHVFGNDLVKNLVNQIFQSNLNDIMSGYRSFTKEFVNTVPTLSLGFEIETELTIRALDYRMRIVEVPLPYRERPAGSFSKLHTFRDGTRVLLQIANIAKAYRPFTFFGYIGLFFMLLTMFSGGIVIVDFLEDQYVNKVPTAIIASAFGLISIGAFSLGVTLHTLNERFRELTHLWRKN